jgi:choloylglycine hydrolase
MCTALTLTTKDGQHLFGRNMDIEFSFNQAPHLVPRNFKYRNVATNEINTTKYAMIGMGTIIDNHPLFGEAMNEKGLACAGLNFPGFSYYEESTIEGKYNIPPYDLILWILSNFETIEELKPELENLNIVKRTLNKSTPLPTLHWIVSDKNGDCIVIENTKEKLSIYDNKVGVLTNSPTFDWHVINLRQYMGIKPTQPDNTKWNKQDLSPLGQGLGTVGLPGNFSPASRFIRTVFYKNSLESKNEEFCGISEFFHILNNVAMINGVVATPEGKSDLTQYTSCMNQEKGIYYYNTYNNNQINAIDMKKENLNSKYIKVFPYRDKLVINNEN